MKKFLIVVGLLTLGYHAYVDYKTKRSIERQALLAEVRLTQGMTLGELQASLGKPSTTEDGYEWEDAGVRAYTFKHTDDVKPYIVEVGEAFPGLVKGARVGGPCSAIPGVHDGGNARELDSAGSDKVWMMIWEESGQHTLKKVSLARMIKKETTTADPYCPRAFSVSGSLQFDADGTPP